MGKAKVLLIAFYNKKALGVRYLESNLLRGGHSVRVVYYKDFNSLHPQQTTAKELALLKKEITEWNPDMIGLSVMSSMYLETVNAVMDMILDNFTIPVVCGGVFATMFPEYFLKRGVRFVIRGDGEIPICQLADALANHDSYESLPSLCYSEGGKAVINEIGSSINDIDEYGIPVINSSSACFIDNDAITNGDPQQNTLSYEIAASRGCPFTCSYCCCPNLRRMLPKGINSVRTRSVSSVIEELVEAKKQCRRIACIRFYDEVFPNLPGWVDNFVEQYKRHINLPFTVWTHPKTVDADALNKLVSAGLTEVIMGIQSGSERIRRNVFHRYETQDEIINATKVIRESGVFWRCYDFMLKHPFETVDDLKESYLLAKKMYGPYELQLHGLNFLPGTDIVPMAIKSGFYTQEEMDAIMYAPIKEQFEAYWQRETTRESDLWYKMLYCYQFNGLRKRVESFESNPVLHGNEIDRLYAYAKKLGKARYYYKKSMIVLKRLKLQNRYDADRKLTRPSEQRART